LLHTVNNIESIIACVVAVFGGKRMGRGGGKIGAVFLLFSCPKLPQTAAT